MLTLALVWGVGVSPNGTLALRAARYFGLEDEPRSTVKVGRWACFIVLPRRRALAYYDEEYTTTGEYIRLSDEQRQALAKALTA